MLYRFLTANENSMLPDSFGRTNVPEVVLRKIGNNIIQIWNIQEGKVVVCSDHFHELLGSFDPKKSLYLYEPGSSLKGSHYEELSIPTMCSVSPDERRYKEFYKNGAAKLYMPSWTLPELQAIRNFAKERHPDQIWLSEQDTYDRFNEFGGIFRHIFSRNIGLVREDQKRAIEDLDPRTFLLDEIDRGRRQVSHLVAQYQVSIEGNHAFRDVQLIS
jgi:hypothetical protein